MQSAAAGQGGWTAEARALLVLAWPMILTNLAQTAMTATDVMMIGRLGPHALAAVALGVNLYFGPLVAGMGFAYATAPLMASERGRQRHSVREIRRTVRQGMWLSILVVIPIWIVLWNAETIFLAMGQDADLAREAAVYLRHLQWASLPFYGYIVLRSFLSALERPGWALAIMIVAIGINALFNYLLIFGHYGFPAYGVAGSGMATTIASTFMFLGLALVTIIHPKFRRYHLFGRFWRPDWPRFRALLKLGAPIAGILAFEVMAFNASAFMMGIIGEDSLAAHSIALQIASISFMVPLGLSQAATVRVGLAYGAQNRAGITLAGWTAYVIGISFMVLTALTMVTVPHLLISVFVDISNPANAGLVVLTTTFLALAALFQVADGAQAVGAGVLRGLQDTKVPMFFAALGYWGIGLPVGALLAFKAGMGGTGVWLGLCAGLAVVGALLLARWLRRDQIGLTTASAVSS